MISGCEPPCQYITVQLLLDNLHEIWHWDPYYENLSRKFKFGYNLALTWRPVWPDQKVSDHILLSFLTRRMWPGVGSMCPSTSVCRHELLPPAMIAQSLAISQNLLSCVSHCRWPRKLSSTSACSFARNLGTHAQKPMLWFRRLLGMRQWVVCKLRSGLGSSKRDGYQLRVMNIHGGSPWAGTRRWQCVPSCWVTGEQLELSDELGLSSDSILSILTEDLDMKYFSAKFSQNCQQSSPTLSRTSWLNIRSRKCCSPPVHRTWSYDSFLFQDMIMLLKGNRLQDTQEINRNATMQLLATPNS